MVGLVPVFQMKRIFNLLRFKAAKTAESMVVHESQLKGGKGVRRGGPSNRFVWITNFSQSKNWWFERKKGESFQGTWLCHLTLCLFWRMPAGLAVWFTNWRELMSWPSNLPSLLVPNIQTMILSFRNDSKEQCLGRLLAHNDNVTT